MERISKVGTNVAKTFFRNVCSTEELLVIINKLLFMEVHLVQENPQGIKLHGD
jgi:hypothetical protein